MTETFVPKFVNQLEFGTEFRSGDVRYKLIHFNDCRAYVQILSNKRAAITKKDKDGKETVLAEFDAPGAKVNISPTTEFDEILRTPAEIEWDSATVTTVDPATGKTTTTTKTPRVKGQRGKPAAETLKRPVNPTKKIGKMVAYLQKGPQPIKSIMSEFSITHGCALSYLFVLNRDYGFGYTVEKDAATLIMPADCKDPFKGAKNEPTVAPAASPDANNEVRHTAAPPARPAGKAASVPAPSKGVRRKTAGAGKSRRGTPAASNRRRKK